MNTSIGEGMDKFTIKEEHENFFAIYYDNCQLCHCKTKENAEKRILDLKKGKNKIRLWQEKKMKREIIIKGSKKDLDDLQFWHACTHSVKPPKDILNPKRWRFQSYKNFGQLM